jgi:hypothetical protein
MSTMMARMTSKPPRVLGPVDRSHGRQCLIVLKAPQHSCFRIDSDNRFQRAKREINVYGHFMPGGNRSAVDRLDDVPAKVA